MDRVNNQCTDIGCDSTAQLIEDHIRMTRFVSVIDCNGNSWCVDTDNLIACPFGKGGETCNEMVKLCNVDLVEFKFFHPTKHGIDVELLLARGAIQPQS